MNPFKRRLLLPYIIVVLIICGVVSAQEPPLKSISYRLAMTRPVSHLFEVAIEVELPNELRDKPIQFQMPRWSPGRYAVFDFAKNVQEFRAVDGACASNTPSTNRPARAVTR
jgi:hypothetical protein